MNVDANEGVSWKARDLWSAPVERSSHEMQEQTSDESMQPSATVCGVQPPDGGRCAPSAGQQIVIWHCTIA